MTPTPADPGVVATAGWVDRPAVPRVVVAARPRHPVESALATAVSWVGYRLTPYVISEARPLLDLATVGSLLGHPALTVPLLAPLYRVGLIAPDGSLVGNLWPWRWMSMDARRSAVDELAGLICLADDVAATLARLGAPIEPSWPGDRITLAALLAADVDPWQPARLLAEALQPMTPYAVNPSGLVVRYRPGVRGEAEREAAVLRRRVEARARARIGRPAPHVLPYAGGGQRRPGAQQRGAELRRDALRPVLRRWPEVTAAEFKIESGSRLSPQAAALQQERAALGLDRLPLAAYGDSATGVATRQRIGDDLRTLRRELRRS
ncbi:hypothetical protein FF36_01872 [Frankia torreyi]|uniref:Uncharacterized protein n=1 Tax=Frankia torreyi TaxID=1856 RepID=A0A0D8BJU7_9ACTN|nr:MULTISPECIES: hypothetical protein [Frankia]KJE23687.1 hypothetical protein FF36_01872 [Frankia torreyi]